MEELKKEFKCKYCGKVCKNANSLRSHEIRCKENPARCIINMDKALETLKNKNPYVYVKKDFES